LNRPAASTATRGGGSGNPAAVRVRCRWCEQARWGPLTCRISRSRLSLGRTSRRKKVSHTERNPVVRATLRLENAGTLDPLVEAVEPAIKSVFGSGRRGRLLRGDWLGHAIHPALTNVALGTWTSASLLDVFGGPEESAAAQKLIGSGLVADSLDRVGRVGGRRATRQASRPGSRWHQWPHDRYLRRLMGGPPPGPAQNGRKAGTWRGRGLESRRISGWSSR
jgi:hypothetical protein